MRLPKRLTFLPALLFIFVCTYGQDVHYNYDRSANLAGYKTYQWVDIRGGAVPDQLIDRDQTSNKVVRSEPLFFLRAAS